MGTSYNVLKGWAPPERGTPFFRFQINERGGMSQRSRKQFHFDFGLQKDLNGITHAFDGFENRQENFLV